MFEHQIREIKKLRSDEQMEGISLHEILENIVQDIEIEMNVDS
jgi:hypothetical protein